MKTTNLLGSLLVAQLLLAGALTLGRDTGGMESHPLLAFPASAVDRIVIDDNSNSTTLQLTGDKWQLAAADKLPANGTRVNSLLDNLASLRTSWPVASTSGSSQRFEVAEDKFQRRLRLYQDDRLLGEYFFGTAPAFRQTHGRRGGEDEIYTLAFNNFDLPGDHNDWLDKSLLGAGTLKRIKGPDFELIRSDEQWQLADTGEEEAPATLNNDAVNELVSALTNLRVLRMEAAPASEALNFEVSADGGEWRYEFIQADSRYYVRRSDQPQSFTISQSDFERIAGKNRTGLSSGEPETVPEEEADEEEQDLP